MLRKLFPLLYLAFSLSAAWAVPIKGKVVGPDGKPVVGAQVLIRQDPFQDKTLTLATDQDGLFKTDLEPLANTAQAFGTATVYAPPLALATVSLAPGDNLIKLESATQVQGVVRDREDKPISDAIVKLQYTQPVPPPEDHWNLTTVPEAWDSKFTVKSGADGQWSITGITPSSLAGIALDDPRYAHQVIQVKAGAPATDAVITARPGAIVTGHVVYADGKPAQDIKVIGIKQGAWGHAQTAADGTYYLASLPSGAITVAVVDPSGQIVAPAISDIELKTGETTKIADFKLMEGALIEGTVTDSASNAPLAGVPLTCYGPHQPARGGGFRIVRTDKAGHYQLRVAPGKNIISVWAQVPKYLPLTKPIQVDIKQGETWQAPIQMVKGLSLVGTVVDKEGKPVANAKFKATLDYQSNHDAQWMEELEADADNMGQWTMDGLAHGKWHLSSAGEWDVISPNEVTVPLDAPLHVTVQKATLWTLKGRVITKGQQPLAGVDIKASVEIYNGYSLRSTVREVQTDAQGQFTIDKLRPTVKLSLATNMHGYNYVSGGQVTQQNAGFVAQDIVLVPLTSRITGRVVDTEGKPVPGAKVMSPDGEIDVQAVADADGKFVLSAVPASQVMVVAGYKGRIGEAHGISSNTAVNITLAPPKPPVASDVQRAYDLLEEVWADTEGMKFYREDIPIVLAADAPDLALKIARKKDGSVDDSMMSQIISNLARSNPAQAAVWAPPNLHQMQNAGAIFTASISLGLAVADINPALARDLYNRAKAYDKGHTDNAAVDQQSIIMRAVSLSKLARRIGAKDEAKQFVAKAVEVFKTIKDKNQEWILCWIAAVDYDQTSKIIDELPSEQRKSVLEEAVMRGANYDPQIARRWLDQLIALEKTDLRSGGAAGLAAQVLIPIIGKTDPAGVLEIARSIPERFYKADTLTLAAQFQPKDVALRVLHEAANAASNQPFDKVGNLARIAALAYNLDPQYGLEVFAMAREAWDSTKAERADGRGAGPNGDDGTAALAYYYSRIDPAESRLLLETEFSRWRRSLAGILDGQDRNKQIGSIATAMVAIDIERAIEMSWIIPTAGRNNGWSPPQLDAQRAIAQYLLLSDNQRHERPFNQWTNSNFFD